MTETVKARLRRFQEKLLDLSKRNRLLNYRPMRASTVPLADELPAEVFRLLVASSKGLKILPAIEERAAEGSTPADAPADRPGRDEGDDSHYDGAPEPAALPMESAAHDLAAEIRAGPSGAPREDSEGVAVAVEPGPEDPDVEAEFSREFLPYRPEELADRHLDDRLQSTLDPQRLDHNLLRIYQQGMSSLEDQGFNTLFLTLGALEWYERDAPDSPLLAPIILVPLELRRRSPRSPFRPLPRRRGPDHQPLARHETRA